MSYFINFAPLRRYRNFRLLYLGQFISFLGTMITGITLPYQVYHETHSTLQVGLLSFFQLLPLLATALMGGLLADRYNRRVLLLISEALLALGCLLLAYNAHLTHPHIGMIFVIAAMMAGITGLHRPALDSIIQQLIPKKDFPTISSLLTLKFSVCTIGGPAIGGLIIAYFGIATTFIMDFATFSISLLALFLMNQTPKPIVEQLETPWTSLKQGFIYAGTRPELLGTYLIDFLAMTFGMPTALFPAIAQYYGGAKTLGMLYAAPAMGALLISLMSGWTLHIKRYGAAITIAAALWGASIILFGLSHHFWLALFFLGLAGGFDTISGIFRMTLWNEVIPSHFRGRLSGIEMISYMSGPRLGDTEAGLIAAAFGITASVVSGGILCVISVAVCSYSLPNFWRYISQRSSDIEEANQTALTEE